MYIASPKASNFKNTDGRIQKKTTTENIIPRLYTIVPCISIQMIIK